MLKIAFLSFWKFESSRSSVLLLYYVPSIINSTPPTLWLQNTFLQHPYVIKSCNMLRNYFRKIFVEFPETFPILISQSKSSTNTHELRKQSRQHCTMRIKLQAQSIPELFRALSSSEASFVLPWPHTVRRPERGERENSGSRILNSVLFKGTVFIAIRHFVQKPEYIYDYNFAFK